MYARNGLVNQAVATAEDIGRRLSARHPDDESSCAVAGMLAQEFVQFLNERGHLSEAQAVRHRFDDELNCYGPLDMPGFLNLLDRQQR